MATKKKKKLDPNQVFVIYTTTRSEIADALNAANEASGELKYKIMPFTPDDPRLTERLCEEIVESLNDGGISHVDELVDLEHQVYEGILDSLFE